VSDLPTAPEADPRTEPDPRTDPEPQRVTPGEEPEDRSDLTDLEELEFTPELLPDPDGVAPRVVAFDIGEVLIDETRVWAVWAELLGVSPLTFAAVLGAAITQGGDHEAVFPHIAPNVDWVEFEDEHERRYGGFRPEDLYPDAATCLEELRSLGFTVIVAGNQPGRRAEQLRALQLPVDVLVTSDELGVEKPDPAFFTALLGLAEVQDPAEVLYVGDRVDNDLVPAAAAGLRTCWLRRGPWGHLQDVPAGVEPDLVLEGLGELPLLLSNWRDA
jgi:HAD superfamily hydrolase (TIGR01549 family)